jgi:hypothetical protein
LRRPALLLGAVSLAAMVVVLLLPGSPAGERLLIPSAVGLLWAVILYAFLATFRAVPDRASGKAGLFERLGRGASRGWYWLLGVVLVGAAVAAALLTHRLASIWWRDYGG